MTRHARVLARCDLFEGLAEDTLALLSAAMVEKQVPASRLLFTQGEAPDGLRIIVEGAVRIWVDDVDGNELTLALLGPGEALGEMALMDRSPRSASAAVTRPSRLLYLGATEFEAILSRDAALSRHLIRLLAGRLRTSNDALLGMAFLPLRARLCRKLLELAETHAEVGAGGAVFKRAFSQNDLGQMLGVSREAINRQLMAMAQEGDVRLTGRTLAIPDLMRLRRASGG